jgi:hypothetical protein
MVDAFIKYYVKIVILFATVFVNPNNDEFVNVNKQKSKLLHAACSIF